MTLSGGSYLSHRIFKGDCGGRVAHGVELFSECHPEGQGLEQAVEFPDRGDAALFHGDIHAPDESILKQAEEDFEES